MCGIVFAGGSLSAGDLEIFNQMLYCDVFRGAHATGIFAKRLNEKVEFAKAAGEPYPFMRTKEYEELTQGKTRYVVAPVFVVGHNRHATRGNADDAKNAHPFQHGNITLVHNGTLTDQSLLPEHNRFVVDSENICYSIDKIGAAETIQKLDGAFTLIWHDASDDTLHIIRNSERPFHLAQVGNFDWFGASEEAMLMWLLGRKSTHKNRITKHFECEIGVEYIFDVSGPSKRCVLRDQIEHKLPSFSYANRYGYGRSQQWQRDLHSTTGTLGNDSAKTGRDAAKTKERERANQVAIDGNIDARIDQRISMSPHQWLAYANGEGRGRITGYIYQENNEYYEVDAHGVFESLWTRCSEDPSVKITGIVTSIVKVNGTVRVVISSPCIETPNNYKSTGTGVSIVKGTNVIPPDDFSAPDVWEDDDIPFEPPLPASFVMDNGATMTLSQWNKHAHSECGGCGKKIPWKDAVSGKALVYANCFWHEECLTTCLDNEGGRSPDTFLCCSCGGEKSMSVLNGTESSRRGEDVCDGCAETIAQARLARSQQNNAAVVGTSVIYIDKSTTAAMTDADAIMHKIFTREEFSRMIKMRESDVATYEDLDKCYVEKRSRDLYAYMFKKGHDLTPKEEKKEDKIPEPVKTFLSSVPTNGEPSDGKVKTLSKTIVNGSKSLHVNKALWTQIGQCTNCYAQIPWRDVEMCSLTAGNRVVCQTCRGK